MQPTSLSNEESLELLCCVGDGEGREGWRK